MSSTGQPAPHTCAPNSGGWFCWICGRQLEWPKPPVYFAQAGGEVKYRKKPVVIEAEQYDGSHESAAFIAGWANEKAAEPWFDYVLRDGKPVDVACHTLEGDLSVSVGDWIIRGVAGEFYPCKPDIFAATYEPVEKP